jgi:hypothetical protein
MFLSFQTFPSRHVHPSSHLTQGITSLRHVTCSFAEAQSVPWICQTWKFVTSCVQAPNKHFPNTILTHTILQNKLNEFIYLKNILYLKNQLMPHPNTIQTLHPSHIGHRFSSVDGNATCFVVMSEQWSKCKEVLPTLYRFCRDPIKLLRTLSCLRTLSWQSVSNEFREWSLCSSTISWEEWT